MLPRNQYQSSYEKEVKVVKLRSLAWLEGWGPLTNCPEHRRVPRNPQDIPSGGAVEGEGGMVPKFSIFQIATVPLKQDSCENCILLLNLQ